MAGDKRTEGAVYFNLLNAVTYFCCSHLGGSHLTMPFQLTYSNTHIYNLCHITDETSVFPQQKPFFYIKNYKIELRFTRF